MPDPKKAAARKPVADPVNSDQLEAQEAASAELAQGPSIGELEERAVEAENRATAAETQALSLQDEIDLLKQQMALLLKAQRAQKAAGATPAAPRDLAPGEIPIFDEDAPYGLVVGDEACAYVQNGHQFGRDKQYITTELHRGTPRAFNPRLVGMTKPRPGLAAVDALEGFRERA